MIVPYLLFYHKNTISIFVPVQLFIYPTQLFQSSEDAAVITKPENKKHIVKKSFHALARVRMHGNLRKSMYHCFLRENSHFFDLSRRNLTF